MSIFQTYQQKSAKDFRRTVGVPYATFMILQGRIEKHIAQIKTDNPIKKRGRKSQLLLEDQLLLTFLYLRQYHTFLSLAMMFNISESYAFKRYNFMVECLLQVLDAPDEDSLKDVFHNCIAIDVSEQPIERPQQEQKAYYSGKKNSIQ